MIPHSIDEVLVLGEPILVGLGVDDVCKMIVGLWVWIVVAGGGKGGGDVGGWLVAIP